MIHTPQYVAIHESAHATAMLACGGSVESVVVAADGSGAMTPLRWAQADTLLLQMDVLTVHLAGPIAAARYARRPMNLDEPENAGDRKRVIAAIELHYWLLNRSEPRDPFNTTLYKMQCAAALEIVTQHWRAINAIASLLIAARTIDGEAARTIFESERSQSVAIPKHSFSATWSMPLAC